MSKWFIVGLAVCGVLWLANRFPGLQGHAFSAGPLSVTYLMIGIALVAFVGMGLKASK